MIRRGEIWWAYLSSPRRSEPGFRRPVVVVQSDTFNRSRIGTVVAATITSNLRLADAPGNVRLSRKESGLPKDSVINVSQIVTVDKAYLADPVRVLPDEKLRKMDEGLRLVLSLEG